MSKNYTKIFEVIALAIIFHLASRFFFYYNIDNPNYQNFKVDKDIVFGFFLICSILIVALILLIIEKSKENAGFAYIIATFVKMVFSYFILSKILHSGNANMKIEKTHFFIIFFVFSAIETLVCIRILNKIK